ncbi:MULTISPECIES: NAD(P)H-binding protein [Paracoccus]|nr:MULTISPECIES: NAD(P)H-binding protein [Paracoccus]MDS9469639.1 NAD(P)H-binding protein [Paracoccus sp. MBLB3053]
MTDEILVVGVGGLGKCMVLEALGRGLRVSVLVRNRTKLEADLGKEIDLQLSQITVGDALRPTVLDAAMAGVDVVLSGKGADPELAAALADAVKRNRVSKLCWPAGTTNVMAEDGITPNYNKLAHLGTWVERAFHAHAACIAAIRAADINHVIFCPGRMAGLGRRSPDVEASLRINRDSGPFVSYEDAAWVMLEAATTHEYDRQLVSAATTV